MIWVTPVLSMAEISGPKPCLYTVIQPEPQIPKAVGVSHTGPESMACSAIIREIYQFHKGSTACLQLSLPSVSQFWAGLSPPSESGDRDASEPYSQPIGMPGNPPGFSFRSLLMFCRQV